MRSVRAMRLGRIIRAIEPELQCGPISDRMLGCEPVKRLLSSVVQTYRFISLSEIDCMSCSRYQFLNRLSAVCLAVTLSSTVFAQDAKLPLGISKDKPASGQFVKTEMGYMVPYTMSIPGRDDVKFTMVPIPGGAYEMGSPANEEGRKDDEGPQIKVAVKPFWMAKTEVSWAEYQTFMSTYAIFKERESQASEMITKLTSSDFKKLKGEKLVTFLKELGDRQGKVVYPDDIGDAITAPTPLYEPGTTYQLGEDPEHPAVTMSQFAARQYTKWMSLMSGNFYRLPTESEWEYAARAGTKTRYFFGDDPAKMNEYAWYTDNSDDVYQHVGTKKPNPWGLHDIYGNVSELVIDQYEADAYKRLSSTEGLLATQTIMPTTKIFPQVHRGGSWDSSTEDLRSAARFRTDVEWRDSDPNLPKSPWWFTEDPAMAVGFRMVRPLDVPEREAQEKFWEMYSDSLTKAVADRIRGGRGVWGLVDPSLADEIKAKQ
jgi:formylglycine-generating enzyme required for sulfatase activity